MRLRFLRYVKRRVDPWSLTALLVALVLLVPMVMVLSGLVQGGPSWEHLQSTVLSTYVGNTLILAATVTVLGLLMAVPAAWCVSIYEFPGRRLCSWLLVLPLSIPTYVAAFVYYQVPEAAIPLLVKIRTEWGVEAFLRAEAIIRYTTVSVFMASVLFPYIYLTARASFSLQSKLLVDAARTLGRSPAATLRSIALPLARPALFAGAVLVVMEVVNDYGAVHLFGIPTLTEGIFRTWFGLEDRTSALRIAGLVIVGVVALLSLEGLQRGRAQYSNQQDSARRRSRIELQGGRVLLPLALCLWPLSIGLFYPLLQLIIWARSTWATVFEPEFVRHLLHSLTLALIAAGALTLIALLLAYAKHLHPTRWLRSTLRAASLGYAAPGAVIAVGVMALFGQVDSWLTSASIQVLLSGSLIAIAFAYCVRFLAVSLNPIQSGVTRIGVSYTEASLSLGHGKGVSLIYIVLPLLSGTLGAAFVLVFVDILKELPLTMILRPADFETMATTAFSLASEGRIRECAVPSLIIVSTCAAALFGIHRLLEPSSK